MVLRLNYVRVTACRTGFRPFFQPPRRILLSALHCLHTKAFSVPQGKKDFSLKKKRAAVEGTQASTDRRVEIKKAGYFICIDT